MARRGGSMMTQAVLNGTRLNHLPKKSGGASNGH